MTCPNCERHKLSASMWRNKAYEASGTPLPWNPEELLLKEYERGRAAGAAAEREALEQIDWTTLLRQGGLVTWGDAETLGDRVIAAIRARSNT